MIDNTINGDRTVAGGGKDVTLAGGLPHHQAIGAGRHWRRVAGGRLET